MLSKMAQVQFPKGKALLRRTGLCSSTIFPLKNTTPGRQVNTDLFLIFSVLEALF
jgi:hypothetical protein